MDGLGGGGWRIGTGCHLVLLVEEVLERMMMARQSTEGSAWGQSPPSGVLDPSLQRSSSAGT